MDPPPHVSEFGAALAVAGLASAAMAAPTARMANVARRRERIIVNLRVPCASGASNAERRPRASHRSSGAAPVTYSRTGRQGSHCVPMAAVLIDFLQ